MLTYQGHPIKILETFESGGIEHACIEALEGKPFVDGAKLPVKTKWLSVQTYKIVDEEKQQKNRNWLLIRSQKAECVWDNGQEV